MNILAHEINIYLDWRLIAALAVGVAAIAGVIGWLVLLKQR